MDKYIKVLCIKSVKISNDRNYVKGNYYYAYQESLNNNISFWILTNQNKWDVGYRFFNNEESNRYKYSEYFIELKKIRKNKLEKIKICC